MRSGHDHHTVQSHFGFTGQSLDHPLVERLGIARRCIGHLAVQVRRGAQREAAGVRLFGFEPVLGGPVQIVIDTCVERFRRTTTPPPA